jgi:hypothetical protein
MVVRQHAAVKTTRPMNYRVAAAQRRYSAVIGRQPEYLIRFH